MKFIRNGDTLINIETIVFIQYLKESTYVYYGNKDKYGYSDERFEMPLEEFLEQIEQPVDISAQIIEVLKEKNKELELRLEEKAKAYSLVADKVTEQTNVIKDLRDKLSLLEAEFKGRKAMEE